MPDTLHQMLVTMPVCAGPGPHTMPKIEGINAPDYLHASAVLCCAVQNLQEA